MQNKEDLLKIKFKIYGKLKERFQSVDADDFDVCFDIVNDEFFTEMDNNIIYNLSFKYNFNNENQVASLNDRKDFLYNMIVKDASFNEFKLKTNVDSF